MLSLADIEGELIAYEKSLERPSISTVKEALQAKVDEHKEKSSRHHH